MNKTLLFNRPKYKALRGKPELLRIILNDKFTRIDFGYQTDPKYIRGGWVTINPETFIRIHNQNENLVLTKVEDIPLEPVKHNFQSTVDRLYFKLYFPPLPKASITFDIIEKEPDSPTYFNYFDVKVKIENGIIVLDKTIS